MVVSLMTTLVVLGLFFYSFATQEKVNAEYFAATDPLELNPNQIMDMGLEQLIVGTRGAFPDSALYRSRYSLLSNMIGRLDNALMPADDVHPFNGAGLRVTNATTNAFDLVVNPAGTFTTDQTDFVINFGRPAHNGSDFFTLNTAESNAYRDYEPDAGYTYPDLNSMFLCLEYTDETGERILIPSFMRPGYYQSLRSSGYAPLYNEGGGFAKRVLRPHPGHVNSDGSARFRKVSAGARQALSGDRNRIINPFPFHVDLDNDGTSDEMGAWDGSNLYELDVDADGDGIRDAIVMDLDHPIINLPNGRQVVPLFAFKVMDADALLNVNAHGNMALVRYLNQKHGLDPNRAIDAIYNLSSGANTTPPIGDLYRRWITQSNMGMNRSEINPAYALSTAPSTTANSDLALLQHRAYYHQLNFNQEQIANVELSWLLSGRPQFNESIPPLPMAVANPMGTNSFDVIGRYGEISRVRTGRLGTSLFSSAGTTNGDDDNDRNMNSGYTGRMNREGRNGGTWYRDSLINVDHPEVVHPLPLGGMGKWLENQGTTVGAVRKRNGVINANPANWPEYETTDLANVGQMVQEVLWQNGNLLSGSAFQAGGFEFLLDEEDEMILSPNFSSADDAPFETSEMAALHLSDRDWRESGLDSRLRLLAPINFEYSRNAQSIRRMFTTDSRDRKEFGYSPSSLRSWEHNAWLDSTGATYEDPNTISFDDAFPPQFGDPSITPNVAVFGTQDPYRRVLRELLAVNFDSKTNVGSRRFYPQHRLDINRLLVNFDAAGNPIYRQLMPHPDDFSTGTPDASVLYNSTTVRPVNHNNASYPAFDSTAVNSIDQQIGAVGAFAAVQLGDAQNNPYAQELWARHDRQRMARDIFMLLMTVGLPDDFNPTIGTTAFGGTADDFPPEQWNIPDAAPMAGNGVGDLVDKMAQFAVNVVDALDRDDVISQFEYDINPGNGWNNSSAEMKTVNGVEHQQLTIGEALWIRTADEGQDYQVTAHDDDQQNQFLHLELRNSWVDTVNFAKGKWRLRRVAQDGMNPVEERILEFQNVNKTVNAGNNFTIAMSSIGVTRPEFWLDTDSSNNSGMTVYELHSPYATPLATWNPSTNATPPGVPFVDWEMAYNTTPTEWAVTGPEGTAFIGFDDATQTESFVDMTLVLERRRNLDLGPTGQIPVDVDWVEVDRFQVGLSDFDFAASVAPQASQADASNELSQVVSQERHETFQNYQEDSTPMTPALHTIRTNSNTNKHAANDSWEDDNAGLRFRLWQTHFDRDYVSKYELMAIPLRSAENLLAGDDIINPTVVLPPSGVAAGLTKKNPYQINDYAGNYFSDPTGRSTALPNRWYRFLEFIEVPSRANEVVYDDLGLVRINPAVVNLNTLRNREVLVGLVDDDYQLNVANADPSLDRTTGSAGFTRSWWDELRIARDGESAAGVHEFPGTPLAKPFRPMSYVRPGSQIQTDPMSNTGLHNLDDNPIQDTLLRFHAGTNGTDDSITGWRVGTIKRQQHMGLFEARALLDVLDETKDGSQVDMHTRNRLLGKLDNHTTVRSNVFLVWVAVRFHDAHNPVNTNNDIVEIGDVADDLPIYRQFLVVDRTRLEEAFNPSTGSFDFEKFIIHRQLIP